MLISMAPTFAFQQRWVPADVCSKKQTRVITCEDLTQFNPLSTEFEYQ